MAAAGAIDQSNILGRIRPNTLAVFHALGALVHVCDGVVDPHAVGAGMLFDEASDGVIRILACPVALPLEQHLLPCHGHDACLHHAIHGVLVRIDGRAARSIGHHVDLIVRIAQAGERKRQIADLRPQAGNHDLLVAVLGIGGERVADVLVVPGVHGRAFEKLVRREDGQQLGEGIAGEAIRLDLRNGRRDVEDLCCLCQANDIVLERLRSIDCTPKAICGC